MDLPPAKPSFEVLYQQAKTCMEGGGIQVALEATDALLDQVDQKNLPTRAKLFANSGFLKASLKNHTAAEEAISESAKLFQQTGDQFGEAIQIGNIGSLSCDKEKFDTATSYYLDALATLENNDHQPGMADQHANLGYTYSHQGKIGEAVQHFQRAAQLYDMLGMNDQVPHCMGNI